MTYPKETYAEAGFECTVQHARLSQVGTRGSEIKVLLERKHKAKKQTKKPSGSKLLKKTEQKVILKQNIKYQFLTCYSRLFNLDMN